MAIKPSSALLRAVAQSKASNQVVKADLSAIQAVANQARDLEFEIKALQERIDEKRAELNELYNTKLPDMLEEAGLDHIGVAPQGNMPGYDYEIVPYYSASIAASWPEEKREEAFGVLKRYKAEDLIKTTVVAKLPKGNLKLARQLVAAARKLKIPTDISLSVHKNTLTAWLREIYEKGKALPQSDLEKISGSVGRVVRPKERKL